MYYSRAASSDRQVHIKVFEEYLIILFIDLVKKGKIPFLECVINQCLFHAINLSLKTVAQRDMLCKEIRFDFNKFAFV